MEKPAEGETVNSTEEKPSITAEIPAKEATVNLTEEKPSVTVDVPAGGVTVNPTEEKPSVTVDVPAGGTTVNPTEEKPSVTADVPAEGVSVNPAEEKPSVTVEILPDEGKEKPEPEEMVKPITGPLLKSVPIEGDLEKIVLVSPNGSTETSSPVNFTWTYTYNKDSSPADVDFKLTLNIKDNDAPDLDTITLAMTFNSNICQNNTCVYSADLSKYKNADVTWYVTAGEKTPENNSLSFKMAIQETTKEPTKTPTPTATPTSTPSPTPLPPEKPKAPVQECPVGRYTVRSLGFYWAPSENAETYSVAWNNDRGQNGTLNLSNNDPTCKNGRCIAYTTLPGVGKYVWTVTAKNNSGSAKSKEMTFEIATNVTTPRAYLPNGTIFNSTYPAFQWEDVEDGVFEYRIQIVGKYDGRIRYDRWFDVKDIYVGNGVCYVKTNLFLPAGTYSWRVLGRNKDFSSRWSSWLDFYVQCDYCNFNNVYYGNYANTVPSTSYPTAVITTVSPEYQWRTLTGASFYQVRVTDASGKEVLSQQVPSSYCTVEMCTWDPGIKLPGNGNYTWTVSGYGPSGGFWGSSTGSFTVQAQIVINPMSFVSPEQNGYLNPESPLIIWTDPGDTAVLFAVQIFDENNNALLSAELDRDQAWCDGLTCSIAFQTIPDGMNYRIAITPYSEYNTQGQMIELVFSKAERTIRLASPKEGSIVQSRPLFRWTLEDGENAVYDLILTDVENNVKIYSSLICGSGGVTCEDGEAFYSPAETLAAGTYTAVLDIPTAGVNGEAIHFTVQ